MTDKKPNQKIILWLQEHWKPIVFGMGLICVLGLSAFAWFQWKGHQEKQAYDRIYIYQAALEKAYKAANGENYKRGRRNITDFFKPKADKPFVYSEEMKRKAGDYERAIQMDQGTLAAAVSAIDLADFYYQTEAKEKAVSLLFPFAHRKADFLSILFEGNRFSSIYTLIRFQLAGFYMNEKNCEKALPLLSAITETKRAKPFYPEAWLQMGLCYEQLQDVARVEEVYGKIKDQYPDSIIAQTAEVYLRLFKISQKKNNQ